MRVHALHVVNSSVASARQECHLATGAAVAARLAGVGTGRAKPAWCVAGCAVCLGRAAPPFPRVLWGLWRRVLGPAANAAAASHCALPAEGRAWGCVFPGTIHHDHLHLPHTSMFLI